MKHPFELSREKLCADLDALRTTCDEINGEFEGYRNISRIESRELSDRITHLERLLRLFWRVAWSGAYIPLVDRDEVEAMILDAEEIANEKLGTMDWKNWHDGDYSVVMGEKIEFSTPAAADSPEGHQAGSTGAGLQDEDGGTGVPGG